MPDPDHPVMPDLIGHLFCHPHLHRQAGGHAAICPPFEVRMLASIVVRTKIAKFGPGQFKFVLAKTEIAVFGPGQHLPGQEIAIILTGHVLGPLARRQRQGFSGTSQGSRKIRKDLFNT